MFRGVDWSPSLRRVSSCTEAWPGVHISAGPHRQQRHVMPLCNLGNGLPAASIWTELPNTLRNYYFSFCFLTPGCFWVFLGAVLQLVLGGARGSTFLSAGSVRRHITAALSAAATPLSQNKLLAGKQGIFSTTFTNHESCFTSWRATRAASLFVQPPHADCFRPYLRVVPHSGLSESESSPHRLNSNKFWRTRTEGDLQITVWHFLCSLIGWH